MIEYLNEHLLPGKLGHFMIVLAFVSSMLAAIGYFFSTQSKSEKMKDSWKWIGRGAFTAHGISVFSVIGILFYVMLNQYYEYTYVWEHVSDDLDFSYIFSAFWEGQEGSFLLWLFWHVVLGAIIMFTAKTFESPVMFIFSAVQFFLVSMILGLYFYIGDDFVKIGSSPMLLLRDVQEAPIFQNPNYVNLIKGNGLNPLLQNYWMTIHPPTLFLGFASTIVPFAYAVAGLWQKKHKEWLKPALPWALFSGAILGLGILMGGAWAYEALSFGGYWAWDPVENMSLVPWLILVAGIHTTLIAKSSGHSIRISYIFYILTFVFILYSTFLTRSGVLGDTSVHAFTEMGLEWQLVIFMFAFLVGPLLLYARRAKTIPIVKKEESVYSREFWMFIGSLVLIFSGILISHTTSIPVYSKIGAWLYDWLQVGFLSEAEMWSPPEDVEAHHNKYQLWIAVFIGFLSGTAQFLRYKAGKLSKGFGRHMAINLGIALVATVAITYAADFRPWQMWVMLFAGLFTISANVDYVISVLRGKIGVSGSAVSHIGFGILIVGVLFSGLNKQIISRDFMSVGVIEGFDDQEVNKNILLRKGLPTQMGEYMVTYQGDTTEGFTRRFNVHFSRQDEAGKELESFVLNPNVLYNRPFTKIEASNPSTKHYLHKDIFTHITALPTSEVDAEAAQAKEDSLVYEKYDLKIGDTMFTTKHYVVFEDFNRSPQHEEYKAQPGDIAVAAKLVARKLGSDSTWAAEPVFLIRKAFTFSFDDKIEELGLKFKFNTIDPETESIEIEVAETTPKVEYVVMQAILFPGINLVWLGSLAMLFGMVMSMRKRYLNNKQLPV